MAKKPFKNHHKSLNSTWAAECIKFQLCISWHFMQSNKSVAYAWRSQTWIKNWRVKCRDLAAVKLVCAVYFYIMALFFSHQHQAHFFGLSTYLYLHMSYRNSLRLGNDPKTPEQERKSERESDVIDGKMTMSQKGKKSWIEKQTIWLKIFGCEKCISSPQFTLPFPPFYIHFVMALKIILNMAQKAVSTAAPVMKLSVANDHWKSLTNSSARVKKKKRTKKSNHLRSVRRNGTLFIK